MYVALGDLFFLCFYLRPNTFSTKDLPSVYLSILLSAAARFDVLTVRCLSPIFANISACVFVFSCSALLISHLYLLPLCKSTHLERRTSSLKSIGTYPLKVLSLKRACVVYYAMFTVAWPFGA